MKPIIRSQLAEALHDLDSVAVERLTAGARVDEVTDAERFYRQLGASLDLSYQGNNTRSALTPAACERLRAYHSDPDREVPVNGEGLLELDLACVDLGHVVRWIPWSKLPEPLATKYRGPHARGGVYLLRNRLGEEVIEWRDGDPTKQGAWNITEEIDDPAVAALLRRPTA